MAARRVPHVIVKLWPGKSERLAKAIMRGVMDTLSYGDEAISVAFEEVAPAEWTTEVYEPDILGKWPTLTKQPGHGEPSAGQRNKQ